MKLFHRPKNRAERAKHVRGLARAFAYLAVTGAVFSAFSVRAARAEMQQQTLTIGRQMLELARASNHEVTPITFNGEKMYLGSSVSEESASAVLDRYEGHCKANPGQPAAGWKDLEKGATKDATKDAPLVTSGLLRSGDASEGTVVCFVRGAGTKATTEEAFKSFGETGDLGAFGKLRFVYAKKGPTGRTVILTAWTDESFSLGRIMPKDGADVPGEDFPEIPRVPSATRALSARADGRPYALNVYKTTEPVAKVVAFYDREMVSRGYKGFDPELDDTIGRTYVKDGVVLTVATHVEPAGNFVALGLAGVTPEETLGARSKAE